MQSPFLSRSMALHSERDPLEGWLFRLDSDEQGGPSVATAASSHPSLCPPLFRFAFAFGFGAPRRGHAARLAPRADCPPRWSSQRCIWDPPSSGRSIRAPRSVGCGRAPASGQNVRQCAVNRKRLRRLRSEAMANKFQVAFHKVFPRIHWGSRVMALAANGYQNRNARQPLALMLPLNQSR